MKMLYRLFALLCLPLLAAAQQTGLSGKVTDASGAVIAGATVDVKEAGASTFHTKSNGDGTWLVPSLNAGDYTVTVTAPGFSTMETKVSMLVGGGRGGHNLIRRRGKHYAE